MTKTAKTTKASSYSGTGSTAARLARAADAMSGLSAGNADKGGQTITRAEAGRTRVAGPAARPQDIQVSKGGDATATSAGPSAKTEKAVARPDQRTVVGGEEGRQSGPSPRTPGSAGSAGSVGKAGAAGKARSSP